MTTSFNVKIEEEVKDKADRIFAELGLDMTTAINIFLRATIRKNSIPFEINMSIPNDTTREAIEEGRKISRDKTVKGYHSIDELRGELEF